MKKSPLIALGFYLLSTSCLLAQDQGSNNAILVSDYGGFLTAVAASDPYCIYDEKSASDLIVRSGAPGSYSYETSVGKNTSLMNYLSWTDIIRCYKWLQNGRAIGGEDMSGMEEERVSSTGTDLFLKSNKINTVDFLSVPFLVSQTSSGNNDVSSTLWKEGEEVLLLAAALIIPAGTMQYDREEDVVRSGNMRYSQSQGAVTMREDAARIAAAFSSLQMSDDDSVDDSFVFQGRISSGGKTQSRRKNNVNDTLSKHTTFPRLLGTQRQATDSSSVQTKQSLLRWDSSTVYTQPLLNVLPGKRRPETRRSSSMRESFSAIGSLSPLTCKELPALKAPAPPFQKNILSGEASSPDVKVKAVLAKIAQRRIQYTPSEIMSVLKRNEIPTISAVEGIPASNAMWQLLSRKLEKITPGTVIVNNNKLLKVGSQGIELYPPASGAEWYLFPETVDFYIEQGVLTNVGN